MVSIQLELFTARRVGFNA